MTYNTTGRYGGFFRVLRYNVGGYGILAVVKTYLLAAWVWQDAIPSYISFKTHTSTPQHLTTYLLAAWVWQDAIPSYISFKTHN